MIISASRRTDIPAFYSKWFFNRIKEGYCCVRNPVYPEKVSKISLSPDVVDGIVFWTKDPSSMLPELHKLDEIGYSYYFQFTLNSYGFEVEPYVPNKGKIMVPTFQRLSDMIGPKRVIWRYDPILLTEKYNIQYHLRYFEELAKRLSKYTEKCVISFVDLYGQVKENTDTLHLLPLGEPEMLTLAKGISEIARGYGLAVESCAERIDLGEYGIEHGHCIDGELLESICGYSLKNHTKDKTQRKECGCMASIDIGTYNTCLHGCQYCYANTNKGIAWKQAVHHNPDSPLLIGSLSSEDVVSTKKMESFRI